MGIQNKMKWGTKTNVSLSRVIGTWYTNSTGKTLVVSVNVNVAAGATCYLANDLGPPNFAHNGYAVSKDFILTIFVPPNGIYAVNGASSIGGWNEQTLG